MATYLYCLVAPVRAEGVPAGTLGILDAPVRTLVAGANSSPIEAWVSTLGDLPTDDRAVTAGFALRHNAVVEAALATGRTPLPARFGQHFADDVACVGDIERRAIDLHAALARVAGCVEMGVLVVEQPGKPIAAGEGAAATGAARRSESGAGRRYLEERRERTRLQEAQFAAHEAALARVTESVQSLVRAESRRRSPTGVWSVSHLVPRELVQTYRDSVERDAQTSSSRIIVVGPRAPYDFSSDGIGEGGHDSGSLISSD